MRVLFSLFVLTLLLDADTVLREIDRPGIRQISVKVSQGFFEEKHLERLARAELKKSRAKFTKLFIFDSSEEIVG